MAYGLWVGVYAIRKLKTGEGWREWCIGLGRNGGDLKRWRVRREIVLTCLLGSAQQQQ